MRSPFLFLAAAALTLPLLAAGCSSSSSTATAPSEEVPPNTIVLSGMTFSPANLTVKVGTTVTWKAEEGAHTVTSGQCGATGDGTFDSGDPAEGFTFTFTFNQTGTFPFFCKVHCSMGMVGTITVTN